MTGCDDFSSAVVESAEDAMGDLGLKLMHFYFQEDDAKKAALMKDVEEKVMPRVLYGLQKLAAAQNCTAGCF